MKKYNYSMVFAFSNYPGFGNPAGVVWDARGLNDDDMQRIAKINNLSETAFVFPTGNEKIPYKVKFFTPAKPIPMCGHASIGLAYVYWKIRGCPEKLIYLQETDVGELEISIYSVDEKPQIYLQMDTPELIDNFDKHRDKIASALRINKSEIANLPVMINSREYLYIPIEHLKTVQEMKPDFNKLLELDNNLGIHGWYVFTHETLNKENKFHSRFFAPTYGVKEDPVTGTANAYFVEYYLKYINPTNNGCFKVEQGFELNKNGIIEVKFNSNNGKIIDVKIGGTACIYIEGNINF